MRKFDDTPPLIRADSIIESMVRRKRLILSIRGALEHHIVPAFLLVIPGFGIYSLIEIYITHTYDGVRPASDLILATFPWGIVSIVMFVYQRKQLRLKEFASSISQVEFKVLLETISERLDLVVIGHNNEVYQFERKTKSFEHAAPIITIIKRDNSIYYNSMYPPGSRQLLRSPKVNRQIESIISEILNNKIRQSSNS